MPFLAGKPKTLGLISGGLALSILALIFIRERTDPGDPVLQQWVKTHPPVAVVFTSRSDPVSFAAAAPEGEVFTYPGQKLWQAKQGRLRLLKPDGTVHELTWGKTFADGSSLVDVMSPSVSPDGKKIIFAGRKGPPDHGHFRLYEINVHGGDLRQITGGPDDEGCIAPPPMRWRNSHSERETESVLLSGLFPLPGWGLNLGLLSRQVIPAPERRMVDFDDVDPVYLRDGEIVFVSSRNPDLGRGHARRATQLWFMKPDGSGKTPYTSNRNNDRWPFLLISNFLVFSSWSRNTEVLNEDGSQIVPFVPGMNSLTRPTNHWMGALLTGTGDRFGALVKIPGAVWRPRPLFNGRIAFMTPLAPERDSTGKPLPGKELPGLFQVMQADPGLTTLVASAKKYDDPLPRQQDIPLFSGPIRDEQGRFMSLGFPGPCPPNLVLLSGAPVEERGPLTPGSYGLYLADQEWQTATSQPLSVQAARLRLLFDDPELVDAEPVAIYNRPINPGDNPSGPVFHAPPKKILTRPDRSTYSTLAGHLANHSLYVDQNPNLPGQLTDKGEGPIFVNPPPDSVTEIRFYASHRDRFDHPFIPRLKGGWELIHREPIQVSQMDAALPAGIPLVLAGFNREGKMVKWLSPAKDSKGHQVYFYALAGDHYSAVRPGRYSQCTGCHPGHSGVIIKQHKEVAK